MQLLQLRIKNLNSLKGEHTIDFVTGPLAATGLFAITGPTGAGKSTILDAITLALYNQTPRSGAVSKNDIARFGSIITRNTDEAWAQLDYQVKGMTYRSHWGISVNRNGNLRDYTLVLSKLQKDGTFVALDVKRNEVPKENGQIIGLNFEQFLRSILLSQGDFARFLKSNANERGELLEKITGTEIYREIGQASYLRLKDENEKLGLLTTQLEGIELLSDEELDQLQQELLEIDNQVKEQRQQLEKLRMAQRLLDEFFKVQQELEKAELALQVNRQLLDAFEPERIRLQQHIKILPLKSDIVAIQNLRSSLEERVVERTSNEERLQTYQEAARQLADDKVKVEEDLKQLREKDEQLHPLLRQVRELDEAIKSEQNNLARLNTSVKSEGEVIDRQHQEIKRLDADIEVQERLVKELNTYLEANKQFEKLGEQLPMFRQLAESIEGQQKLFVQKLQEMEESPTRQQLVTAVEPSAQALILETAIEQSQRFINEKSKQFDGQLLDKEVLFDEIKKLQFRERTVDKVCELDKERTVLTREQLALSQIAGKAAKDLELNSKELEQVEKALAISQKYLDELKIRRERELLEAKYEEARQLLKPDVPCPLCGSLEHPFVKHYCDSSSQTESLLAERNREQQQLKQKEKDLVARVSKAQSDVDSTKQQSTQLFEKKDSYTKLIEQMIADWSWHDGSDLSQRLQDEKDQLKNQLLAKENAVKLLEQLQKAASRNKDFIHLKEQIDAVVADNIKFYSFVNDYSIGLNGCSLKEVIAILEQHFKAYDAKKKQLQQSENQCLQNSVSRKEKGAQLMESMLRYANLDKELEAVKKLLGDKQKERLELFGEQLTDVAEAGMKRQLETATIAHNKLEVSIKENSTLCKTLNERQQVLQEHIQKDQKRLLTDSEALLTKLDALGIISIEAALEALLEAPIVADLEAKQQGLDNDKAKLEHYCSDNSKKLSELKDKVAEIDESADEIVEKIKMQEAGLEAFLSRRGGISERIKSDVNNKARHQEKAQAIKVQEQEVNRWAQLSELIGDATGNKFARFAQELTLRQVLLLANSHLKRLSDRYVIKHVKAENLDELFVADTYHGNAERSVKTLSGGESFLVSLSLALGLSDLAGQNTVIGSLFIDEGFGTLDQSTLDVALSALEKLQSETRRTIGIISHVPALKERVTTQIELKKDANGYSTLEIKF